MKTFNQICNETLPSLMRCEAEGLGMININPTYKRLSQCLYEYVSPLGHKTYCVKFSVNAKVMYYYFEDLTTAEQFRNTNWKPCKAVRTRLATAKIFDRNY